ncbi:hypothetical protein VTK26DRAFT_6186 [Humicola hyalothermophila]
MVNRTVRKTSSRSRLPPADPSPSWTGVRFPGSGNLARLAVVALLIDLMFPSVVLFLLSFTPALAADNSPYRIGNSNFTLLQPVSGAVLRQLLHLSTLTHHETTPRYIPPTLVANCIIQDCAALRDKRIQGKRFSRRQLAAHGKPLARRTELRSNGGQRPTTETPASS